MSDPYLARLGLGNSQDRFEAGRVGDLGQHRACGDLLADLDQHLLQHSGRAGANGQTVELLSFQGEQRTSLFDAGALARKSGMRRSGVNIRPAFLGFVDLLELRDLQP